MYLDEYDRCYGLNKTKYYFKKILEEKGLASEVCQKLSHKCIHEHWETKQQIQS